MSKKLLSAVLAIAMMLSMCTGLMTSAASDYEADRAALKEAIRELTIKGPSISESALEFIFHELVIVSGDDLLERNKVFEVFSTSRNLRGEPLHLNNTGKADGNNPAYFLKGDVSTVEAQQAIIPDTFEAYAKYAYDAQHQTPGSDQGNRWLEGWVNCSMFIETSYLSKVAEGILLYAASVWYFGEQPELEGIVDEKFNVRRNALVKEATALIKSFISFLRGQVGAYALNNLTAADENKPSLYAEKAWAWRQQYAYKYHANYGVNPFEGLEDTLVNEWWTILVGNNLVTALAFPGWYSFEEMRANSTVAPLLNTFERLYRAAQTVKLNGVLYYEFVVGTKADLENSWKALVNALLSKYTFTAPAGISAVEAVKSIHRLQEVLDFYDLYISDAYLNIYTSVDKELLSKVTFAKMLVEWVDANANSTSVIYYMGVEYFAELADNIIAGIEALDPTVSNLALTNEDIDTGVALINEGQVLLDAWGNIFKNYSAKDPNGANYNQRIAYDALKAAIADLKVMLPYDAASKATYVIKANTTDYVRVDFDGSNIVAKNNAATIEFAPNYFAFLRYYDALVLAVNFFNSAVDEWNSRTEILDPVAIANNYSYKKLVNVLLKYDFLAGFQVYSDGGSDLWYINDRDVLDPFKYQQILKDAIWPYVTGGAHVGGPVNDDKAWDQMVVFSEMFQEACARLNGDSYSTTYFNEVDFSGNSWDWSTGKVTGLKNGWDTIAAQLEEMLAYLTVDMSQLLNIYRYVTLTMWNVFDPNNGAVTGIQKDGNSFAGGAANIKGSLIYNFQQTLLPLFSICDNSTRVNLADLTKMINRFLSCTRALLTEDRGQPLFDQFLADINSWAVTSKVGMDNNPWALYEKLCEVYGTPGISSALKLPVMNDEPEPYLYYNLTLKSVLNYNSNANKYSWKDQFVRNIYEPIAAASQALATVNVSNYDTEWVEKYSEVRDQCGYFLNMINLNAADGHAAVNNSDIPLWVVLNLYNQILEVNGEKGEHTVSALELYKTTALDPVLAEAYGKNMNDYNTVGEGNKIWLGYTQAYANALKVRNSTRAPKAEIDAAAAALVSALEALANIAKAEPSATVEDLNNVIAEATALLARVDVEAASADALDAAIKEAKDFVNDLRYVVTYTKADIDAAIDALQAAIDAVNEEVYFADDLAAYLSFVGQSAKVNADNYTEESYKAFVLAYNEAKAVAETTTNASAYLAAKALVEAAYNALEEPEMSKTLVAAVAKLAELKAVDTAAYSAESVAAYNAAVAALEAAIEAAAEDDVLLDLIAKAYLAKANLAIANPITLDD